MSYKILKRREWAEETPELRAADEDMHIQGNKLWLLILRGWTRET